MSATAPQEMGKRVAGSFALPSMVNVLPALAIVSIDMIPFTRIILQLERRRLTID